MDFPLDKNEGETLSGIFDALVHSGAKFDGGRRDIERPRDVIRWILEKVGNDDGKKTKTTPLSRKGAGVGAARCVARNAGGQDV